MTPAQAAAVLDRCLAALDGTKHAALIADLAAVRHELVSEPSTDYSLPAQMCIWCDRDGPYHDSSQSVAGKPQPRFCPYQAKKEKVYTPRGVPAAPCPPDSMQLFGHDLETSPSRLWDNVRDGDVVQLIRMPPPKLKRVRPMRDYSASSYVEWPVFARRVKRILAERGFATSLSQAGWMAISIAGSGSIEYVFEKETDDEIFKRLGYEIREGIAYGERDGD